MRNYAKTRIASKTHRIYFDAFLFGLLLSFACRMRLKAFDRGLHGFWFSLTPFKDKTIISFRYGMSLEFGLRYVGFCLIGEYASNR